LNVHAALAVHLVPVLGADTPVDTVDRDALQRWVDSLVAQGYALGTVELTAAGVSSAGDPGRAFPRADLRRALTGGPKGKARERHKAS
jgi:hypothetical protein